jgi:hypothetical protein
MIEGWLLNPAPASEPVAAMLPVPHVARYYETLNTQPPGSMNALENGFGEVELVKDHRFFSVRLIKHSVFDIVMLDTLVQ